MPPKQKKKLSFADEMQDKVETVHIEKEMKKKHAPAKGLAAAKAAAGRGAKKSGAAAAKKGIITSQHAKAQVAERRNMKKTADADDEKVGAPDSADGMVEAESSSDSSRHSAEGSGGDDDKDPFVKAKKTGAKLAYPALRLRFLPSEFQEPQLYKFLNQFGATVLNCFCVRSKRTHQSKGIAYVQFDDPNVLPIVLEECHGMALGGRALKASIVTMHRAMPPKELVARRRAVAYAYATKGRPVTQYVAKKTPLAQLIKATQSEKENNAHLKRLGIPFESHCFGSQLQAVPAEMRKRTREASAESQKAPEEDAVRTPQRASTRQSADMTPSPKVEAIATPQGSAKKGGDGSAQKVGDRAGSIVLDAISPSPAKGRSGSRSKKEKSVSRSPSTKK